MGWSEPTCKSQNKPKESAENTAKGIYSPTLYGAHLSIIKNIAFALGSVGRMVEHGGQRRQTLQTRRLDINWNASNRRRGYPLQEDLCRHAQGRRPQFGLLVAKYNNIIHRTVRTDADRARFDWL